MFQVLLDHPEALEQLKKRPLRDGRLWHVWMKLDCANGRGKYPGRPGRIIIYFCDVYCKILCLHLAAAGVLHSDPSALRLALAIAQADGVELTGVYAHCGNTYNCKGVEQIQAVAKETTSLTLQFMEKYDTECRVSQYVREPI